MKKLVAYITVILCLAVLPFALANELVTTDEPALETKLDNIHQFFDYSFGMSLDETAALIKESLNQDATQMPDNDGIVRQLSVNNIDMDLFGKPIKEVSFGFYESYKEMDKNNESITKYVEESGPSLRFATAQFDLKTQQKGEYYTTYLSDIFENACAQYGQPTAGSMEITKTLTSSDLLKYDLPIKDNKLDVDTLYKACNDNFMVFCRIQFDNVRLSYISMLKSGILHAEFLNTIKDMDNKDTPSIGYYGEDVPEPADLSTVDFSFRNNVTFGMTKEETIAAEGVAPTQSTNDYIAYADVQAAGHSSTLVYAFTSDRLTTILLMFTQKHTNSNDYISDFEAIDKSLVSKYGIPSTDQYYSWKDKTFKNDKDNYGLAITCGDLKITSSWEKDGYTLIHYLSGDNYEIQHQMGYVASDLVGKPNTDGI